MESQCSLTEKCYVVKFLIPHSIYSFNAILVKFQQATFFVDVDKFKPWALKYGLCIMNSFQRGAIGKEWGIRVILQ